MDEFIRSICIDAKNDSELENKPEKKKETDKGIEKCLEQKTKLSLCLNSYEENECQSLEELYDKCMNKQ